MRWFVQAASGLSAHVPTRLCTPVTDANDSWLQPQLPGTKNNANPVRGRSQVSVQASTPTSTYCSCIWQQNYACDSCGLQAAQQMSADNPPSTKIDNRHMHMVALVSHMTKAQKAKQALQAMHFRQARTSSLRLPA